MKGYSNIRTGPGSPIMPGRTPAMNASAIGPCISPLSIGSTESQWSGRLLALEFVRRFLLVNYGQHVIDDQVHGGIGLGRLAVEDRLHDIFMGLDIGRDTVDPRGEGDRRRQRRADHFLELVIEG